jgi:hypothetical protein
MRMAEAGERTCFVEEALAAPGEIVGEARAARHHLCLVLADGELDREILLDGHRLRELGVERSIGNAETAVPDHRVESEVVELRADRQGLDVVGIHGGMRASAP